MQGPREAGLARVAQSTLDELGNSLKSTYTWSAKKALMHVPGNPRPKGSKLARTTQAECSELSQWSEVTTIMPTISGYTGSQLNGSGSRAVHHAHRHHILEHSMRLSHINIQNYRAHADTALPLHQLGCLIGENNAGKSSVLHAIQFVLEGRRLSNDDFRRTDLPVSVSLTIDEITDGDIQRVAEKHRDRVRGMVEEGRLTIIRQQEYNATADTQYMSLRPKDSSMSSESLAGVMTGKKGAELRKAVVDICPALDTHLAESPTQKEVRETLDEVVANLPKDDLKLTPTPFPTGIGAAIKPLLPSVIYIEAVKDVSIEAKSTGTSAFSKLLELLFSEVSEEFANISEEFNVVYQKLNKSLDEDGAEIDDRLDAVKQVESTIEEYIQASFPGVQLRMEVPTPTLTTILAGAELLVDDGHEGSVTTKGDGLKRTVLFALLRAYARLRTTGLIDGEQNASDLPAYVLLFEEPELYLHPRAQRQLMAALGTFSKEHQVIVTTHAPGFFRPGTDGFARLQKTENGVDARSVDLQIDNRDAYQMIQHENNEAAFFARRVVLVEGDSDTFTYPHIAKLLKSSWDDIDRNIMFVKIEGKGNVRRYRKFFQDFDVPVHVITDLDAVIEGFNQLTESKEIRDEHAKLMQMLSCKVPDDGTPNGKKIRKIAERRKPRELWIKARNLLSDWQSNPTSETAGEIVDTLDCLFESGSSSNAKLDCLKESGSNEISDLCDSIITALREENVHVLRRGDLETYCGTNPGNDKISTAIEFCQSTITVDSFRSIHGSSAGDIISELEEIFARIYD